jgi:hypothetical protein
MNGAPSPVPLYAFYVYRENIIFGKAEWNYITLNV